MVEGCKENDFGRGRAFFDDFGECVVEHVVGVDLGTFFLVFLLDHPDLLDSVDSLDFLHFGKWFVDFLDFLVRGDLEFREGFLKIRPGLCFRACSCFLP